MKTPPLKEYITVVKTVLAKDAPILHRSIVNAWRAMRRRCRAVAAWAVRVWTRVSSFVRMVVARYKALPHAIKVLSILLVVLCGFVIWQICASKVSQPVFITVNLLTSALLTALVCYLAVDTQNIINYERGRADALQAQGEKRDQEMARLKADLFDLRSKERRKNAANKNNQHFIDTVRKLAQKRSDADERFQFVADALVQCFDNIGGAVVYGALHDEEQRFGLCGRYALAGEPQETVFVPDEGIVGQVIRDGQQRTLSRVPADYLAALSGLGRSQSLNLYVLPLKNAQGEVEAVIETATFGKLAAAANWEEIETSLRDSIS